MRHNTKPISIILSIVPVLVVAILGIGTAWSDGKSSRHVPPALVSAIQKTYPDTKILDSDEVETEDCGEIKNAPGFLVADFNGDGIDDYAVVLRKTKSRNNLQYGQVRDYLVVTFFGKKDGTFQDLKLAEFEQAETTVWFITLINQKSLYDFERNEEVKLSNPALALIRCGGGSMRFYWDGKEFRNGGGT